MLLDETDLRAVVDRLAAELSDAYDDGVVLVAVLRGSVPFLADLVRAMTIRATVDFVSLSPYTPGTGRVRFVMDASTNLTELDAARGRQVGFAATSYSLLGIGALGVGLHFAL